MVRAHNYYVYIVASASRTLYVGVTDDLERRMWQHRIKTLGGFTARYDVSRLVWFEWHTQIDDAIAREKQVKGGREPRRSPLSSRKTRSGGT